MKHKWQIPKIMANSKDAQGHKDKYLDTSRNILSQEILMWNIKALALTFQKLLARLKFQSGGQNDRLTEWQTDRMTKTICPPYFDLGGIKIHNSISTKKDNK